VVWGLWGELVARILELHVCHARARRPARVSRSVAVASTPTSISTAATTVIVIRLMALAGHLPESYAHVLPPEESQAGEYHRLIPDILVTPSRFPIDAAWTSTSGCCSPSRS
jgi:hypothetical protein